MPITITVNGNRSLDAYSDSLESVGVIRTGDVVYALQNQAARILDRTAHHVDAFGAGFVPYNKTTPYYYKPPGARYAKDEKSARSARNKAHRALGGLGKRSRGLSIRFDSYDAFKRALGRTGVDLMGPDAPHMLQQMQIRTKDGVIQLQGMTKSDLDQVLNLTESAGPVSLGIYDGIENKGSIAAVHNEGQFGMPIREFFALGGTDVEKILRDLENRINARLRKI